MCVEIVLVHRSHTTKDEEEDAHHGASEDERRTTADHVNVEPGDDNSDKGNHILDDVEEESLVTETLRLIEDDAILGRKRLASDLLTKHGENGDGCTDLHLVAHH